MDYGEVQIADKSIYADSIRESIEAIPEKYLSMSETELRGRARPSLQLYELKQSFWNEVFKSQENGVRITMHRICKNICSYPFFRHHVINSPLNMAWITAPLVVYEDRARAVLMRLTERYEELASMEITTTKRYKHEGEWKERSETCPKKAAVLLQVIKNMEERIKGVAVQRQVTVVANNPTTRDNEMAILDVETVNQKLKEIEAKLILTGVDDGKDRLCREDEEIN